MTKKRGKKERKEEKLKKKMQKDVQFPLMRRGGYEKAKDRKIGTGENCLLKMRL